MQVYFPISDVESSPPYPLEIPITKKSHWGQVEKAIRPLEQQSTITINEIVRAIQNIPGNEKLDLSGFQLFADKFLSMFSYVLLIHEDNTMQVIHKRNFFTISHCP